MIDYTVVTADGVQDRRGGPDRLRADAAADGAFVWVELDAPSPDVLDAALAALDLDHFGIETGQTVHRRPKVEFSDRAVLLLVKTVWYIEATRQVETGDFALVSDGRSLITVRRGVVDPVPAVRDRLADADFRSEGAPGIVLALLDSIVERYDGAVEDLTDDVGDLERAVFSGSRTDRNQEIYFLIRETLEFQDAVRPLVPFAQLLKGRRAPSPLFQRKRFGDIAGHLIRIDAAIETSMSLLTTVLTAHQGQIGTWQNEDMKKISAWAAIAVVPTAIAGIYGMNFRYMPELHWKVGYPLVMLLILAVCVLLHRGFKRNGWLLRIDVPELQYGQEEGRSHRAPHRERCDRAAVPPLRPCLPS